MASSLFINRLDARSSMDRSTIFFWLGFWSLFVKFFLESITLFEVDDAIFKVLQLFGCVFLLLRIVVLALGGSSGFTGVFLGILSYLLSGESVLLTTSLILSAAYEIDFQSILRSWTRAVSAVLISMLWAYLISKVLGVSIGKTWLDIGGINSSRAALFFVHPNFCAAVFFFWAMAMWCRFDVGVGTKAFVGAIAAAAIIVIAGSRTSAVSLVLFFVFTFVFKTWNSRLHESFCASASKIAFVIPILLIILTYWISAVWFTSSAFSQSASDFLTGRPALWWAQWNYAGLSLFGHHAFEGNLIIRGTMHDIHTVDGMYASFLFNIGVSGFIWFLVLVKRSLESGECCEPVYVAALIAVFIFGFTEWHSLNAVVCVPLILLAQGVRKAKKGGV